MPSGGRRHAGARSEADFGFGSGYPEMSASGSRWRMAHRIRHDVSILQPGDDATRVSEIRPATVCRRNDDRSVALLREYFTREILEREAVIQIRELLKQLRRIQVDLAHAAPQEGTPGF